MNKLKVNQIRNTHNMQWDRAPGHVYKDFATIIVELKSEEFIPCEYEEWDGFNEVDNYYPLGEAKETKEEAQAVLDKIWHSREMEPRNFENE